ncbi:RidA family protein [Sphingobacterium corticis]|uniref:RidA family protein n=1 Tax=Sphingobacterium corticis TaxID=1812823 RepID=A0ABW5NL69_9SPHI
MKKTIINPWNWQDARGYSQAVEVQDVSATLYVSGQTAIDDHALSSNASMRDQLTWSIQNLEKVVLKAGYELENIVRLNIYTTSTSELFQHFDVMQDWIVLHGIKQASTVLEVSKLFETLIVELEATVVR